MANSKSGWNSLSSKQQASFKKKNFDMKKKVTEAQLNLLRKQGTPTQAIKKYASDPKMREALNRFYGKATVSKIAGSLPSVAKKPTPSRVNKMSVAPGGESPTKRPAKTATNPKKKVLVNSPSLKNGGTPSSLFVNAPYPKKVTSSKPSSKSSTSPSKRVSGRLDALAKTKNAAKLQRKTNRGD